MRIIVSYFLVAALLCSLLPALGETVPGGTAAQIVVSFTGDCTLGCDPRERGRNTGFEAYIQKYGYGYPFEKVKQYFEQDDLTVINLEGTFYDYDANLEPNSTYHFRGPTDFVNILTESGIEACSIGNNHIMDYGAPGMESTVQTLDAAGIHWFGTVDGGADGAYVFEKDGAKIGFISVYYSDWFTLTSRNAIRTKLVEHMQAMKADGCGLIIACMHSGVEYDIRHSKKPEEMADWLIDHGASIVIGTHPHSIQGLREENGVCTLWSLGNFSFGGNSSVVVPRKKSPIYGQINLNTYIAQFTFSFDEHGVYLGHQLNIIPCHVSGSAEYNNYQPVPVTGADAENVIKALQRDIYPHRMKLKPYAEGIGAVQDFVPAPAQ